MKISLRIIKKPKGTPKLLRMLTCSKKADADGIELRGFPGSGRHSELQFKDSLFS
jgi:hypothetical protein